MEHWCNGSTTDFDSVGSRSSRLCSAIRLTVSEYGNTLFLLSQIISPERNRGNYDSAIYDNVAQQGRAYAERVLVSQVQFLPLSKLLDRNEMTPRKDEV